jgi:hypothetical protein
MGSRKKGWASYRGKFPSLKLGRVVLYKSLLVRDYLYLLEFDPEVNLYQEDPLEITYNCADEVRAFAPDLLVCRPNRRQLIKLSYDECPHEGECPGQLRALDRACRRLGYEYGLIAATVVGRQPFLNNVKALWKYAGVPVEAPQYQLLCMEFFRHREIAQLGDVIEFFESQGASAREVFALAFRGVLFADMNSPLTKQSLIHYHGAVSAA